MHFQRAAPEKLSYAINRYRREAERHYTVLDKQLERRDFIVGSGYTIADISGWGWMTARVSCCPVATTRLGASDTLLCASLSSPSRSEDGLAYAIAANTDRGLLLKVAEIIYNQNSPDAAKAKLPPAPGKPS